MTTAARAGTPNSTGSLWLHLEISHSNCSTGIPGTMHGKEENMENTTTILGTLPFFPCQGRRGLPWMHHLNSHTVAPTTLSNTKQEFCSSGYARKNSNCTIKKKYSLPFTAVIDGML